MSITPVVKYGEISQWRLAIVFNDDDNRMLDYQDALMRLQPWNTIDANQINISAKRGVELTALFGGLNEI